MFIELCFNFMSVFAHLCLLVVRYLFPCLTFSSSCAMLPHPAGLLVVPAAYLGPIGYFLT
jgi:hypothetical protein